MASNPSGSSGAPGGSNPPHDTPPKYVPQFSAATEMILKRIQSGQSASLSSIGIMNITGTPPGYENMRRSILNSMKTSENMEIPSTPVPPRKNAANRTSTASGSASRASATPTAAGASSSFGKGRVTKGRGRGKAGTKRKRANKDEESEESEEESDSDMSKLGGDSDSDDEEDNGSVSTLPKMTLSGRQVNKPAQFIPAAYEHPPKRRAPSRKSDEHVLCKKCGRGHSPETNMIVFCDGCNDGWHQQCHDPPVSEEAVKDEKAAWFCLECSTKRGIKLAQSSQPADQVQPAQELVQNVSWAGRPDGEKRVYLSSLSQPHLVSLLMQAITLHPNLPIFPPTPLHVQPQDFHAQAPSHIFTTITNASTAARTVTRPGQYFPTPNTAGLFARAEANPNATMNFIRKIPSGSSQSPTISTPPPGSNTLFHHASSAPLTLVPGQAQTQEQDSRESTPASPPYPKAGTGLMSKLPTDEDDIDWLVDNNDFEAFSHTMYDDHGEKIEENRMVIGA